MFRFVAFHTQCLRHHNDRIESNLWVRTFCKSPCRNAIGTSDILQWGSKVIGCTHKCRWKNASRTAAAKPIIARCSQTSNSPGARPSTNFPLSSLSCIGAPGGVVDYQGEMQLMLNLQQSLHHPWDTKLKSWQPCRINFRPISVTFAHSSAGRLSFLRFQSPGDPGLQSLMNSPLFPPLMNIARRTRPHSEHHKFLAARLSCACTAPPSSCEGKKQTFPALPSHRPP